MMKKMLSLVLTLVLVFSVTVMPVSASTSDQNLEQKTTDTYAYVNDDGTVNIALDTEGVTDEEGITYTIEIYGPQNKNSRVWMSLGTVEATVYSTYWTYLMRPNLGVGFPSGYVEYRGINSSGGYTGHYSAIGLANICYKPSSAKMMYADFYLSSINGISEASMALRCY